MRRAKQALAAEEIQQVLEENTSGVLSLIDDKYPYSVPLSYAAEESRIYFHAANEGKKLDVIKQNPAATFCVIDSDNVIPEKFTTAYRSVTAFGRIEIAEGSQRYHGLELLAEKYCVEVGKDMAQAEIEKFDRHTTVFVLNIDIITGKKGSQFR